MSNVKIFTALLFVCFFACKTKNSTKPEVVKEEKNICSPYFNFDEIEHYSIKIDEREIFKIYERMKKTVNENKLVKLIMEDTLDKISDTTILSSIDKCGFVKKEVSQSKFESINNIFCERKHADAMYAACGAFYRDILVFKKQNRIIGTAKICFECGAHIIVGTQLNTMEFGQSGDYGRLRKLLYN